MTLPIFPLNGVLLLPNGNLPLNIFEPRYISLLKYAQRKEKLIGMIQTKTNKTDLYSIGCVGEINSLTKVADKKYLINLHGLARFIIINELKTDSKFRVFNVKYDNLNESFLDFKQKDFDKKKFLEKTNFYFKKNGLTLDTGTLGKIDDKYLIIMISMACRFNDNEVQLLLESKNINHLANILITLLDFSIHKHNNYLDDSIN